MSEKGAKPPGDKDEKAARLAAALRANLRRRKAPARAVKGPGSGEGAES